MIASLTQPGSALAGANFPNAAYSKESTKPRISVTVHATSRCDSCVQTFTLAGGPGLIQEVAVSLEIRTTGGTQDLNNANRGAVPEYLTNDAGEHRLFNHSRVACTFCCTNCAAFTRDV